MSTPDAPRSPAFSLDDLAAVLVPASPVVVGAEVVYALRCTDVARHKTLSSLWSVPLSGAGEPRPLTPGQWADRAPQADPRGQFLVFVSSRGLGDQVYRLEVGGGDARRLTALPRGTIGELALSPDGRQIALVLSPAAPVDDALPLAADLARAEPDATPAEAEPAPAVEPAPPEDDAPGPLPRARVIARLRNREDGIGWFGGARAHVWVVDAATGKARRVTTGPRDFAAPTWTPAGDAIVTVATRLEPAGDPDRDSMRNEIVRVDLARGRVDAIDKPEGAALAPSVSPQGDRVAYLLVGPLDFFGARNPAVWVSSLDGVGAPQSLTAALDRPAIDLVIDDLGGGTFLPVPAIWSAAGDELTIVVTDRGSVRLFVQPVDGGPGRYLTAPERSVSSPSPSGSGSIAAIVADGAHFAEVGRVAADGEVGVLTRHNGPLAARIRPRSPEPVRVERDGVTLHGYYLPPRNAAPGARAPAILYVHGGPHVCYGERLFFEMQWLADAGYAVLYGNPRGSHSYGEAYSSAIDFHWGEPDTGDQLALADWLAARPEVDPARLGVTGGSYGGIMTVFLCGATERFGAAVAQRGLYDWATSVGTSDYGHESARWFDGVWPWQDPQRYLAQSPIRFVEEIRTPLLVMHSEGDLRTGPSQALELFCAGSTGAWSACGRFVVGSTPGCEGTERLDRRVLGPPAARHIPLKNSENYPGGTGPWLRSLAAHQHRVATGAVPARVRGRTFHLQTRGSVNDSADTARHGGCCAPASIPAPRSPANVREPPQIS